MENLLATRSTRGEIVSGRPGSLTGTSRSRSFQASRYWFSPMQRPVRYERLGASSPRLAEKGAEDAEDRSGLRRLGARAARPRAGGDPREEHRRQPRGGERRQGLGPDAGPGGRPPPPPSPPPPP